MNTTSVHIKIDHALKDQAQKTSEELGLSLSAVIKVLLKQFIRTKRLSVELDETPNKYLIQALKQSDEDIKTGNVTSFKNGQDALDYLQGEIEHEKQARSTR